MQVGFRSGHGLLVSLIVALSLCASALADGVADNVVVNDPYVRAVPPVMRTTAAFMQLQSSNADEHFLVSASTPAAAVVELHMHTMDEGVMRMRQIPHIHLPPNKTVTLEPGGLHIMLFDLKASPRPGDKIPITLKFDDGSSKQVFAVVRPVDGMMQH